VSCCILIRPANGFSVGRPSGRLVGLKPDLQAKQYRAGSIGIRGLSHCKLRSDLALDGVHQPSAFRRGVIQLFDPQAGLARSFDTISDHRLAVTACCRFTRVKQRVSRGRPERKQGARGCDIGFSVRQHIAGFLADLDCAVMRLRRRFARRRDGASRQRQREQGGEGWGGDVHVKWFCRWTVKREIYTAALEPAAPSV